MSMLSSYIREQGATLASLGYQVCAIAPGAKRPMGQNWGERPLSEEQCADYIEKQAGAGVICGKGSRVGQAWHEEDCHGFLP